MCKYVTSNFDFNLCAKKRTEANETEISVSCRKNGYIRKNTCRCEGRELAPTLTSRPFNHLFPPLQLTIYLSFMCIFMPQMVNKPATKPQERARGAWYRFPLLPYNIAAIANILTNHRTVGCGGLWLQLVNFFTATITSNIYYYIYICVNIYRFQLTF